MHRASCAYRSILPATRSRHLSRCLARNDIEKYFKNFIGGSGGLLWVKGEDEVYKSGNRWDGIYFCFCNAVDFSQMRKNNLV